jgi:hypothetical protein
MGSHNGSGGDAEGGHGSRHGDKRAAKAADAAAPPHDKRRRRRAGSAAGAGGGAWPARSWLLLAGAAAVVSCQLYLSHHLSHAAAGGLDGSKGGGAAAAAAAAAGACPSRPCVAIDPGDAAPLPQPWGGLAWEEVNNAGEAGLHVEARGFGGFASHPLVFALAEAVAKAVGRRDGGPGRALPCRPRAAGGRPAGRALWG